MSNVFFQVLSNNTRTLIYIIPAIALSFLFNVPKFLEVTTREKNGINEVNTSSLRRDPDYIFWYSMYIIWHPTLTTGILPFIVLTYMNTRIYMEIKQSRLVSQTKENFVNYFLQILSGKQSTKPRGVVFSTDWHPPGCQTLENSQNYNSHLNSSNVATTYVYNV